MTEPTSGLPPALRDRTFRWIADDVDPRARTELQAVLARAMAGEASAIADLQDRLAGPLTFGTAGLRGPVRAGPNGMNRAVVVRATAGVAAWLTRGGHAGGTVVVGRDGRHGSEDFATAAAEVLTAAGFRALVSPGPVPTPVLAFAAGRLGAVAGIQVTASHNPPADNGYKVYDSDAAQIVPPADRDIEALIDAAPAAVSVPRQAGAGTLPGDVVDEYLSRVATLPKGTGRSLRVAATALHGVGGEPLHRALELAGFHDVHLVAEQAEPDPDFPTVRFPNPEEPGAADRVLALAAEVGADLAIALDPDADRCALGVPEPTGRWRMLSGDETGALLGEHVLATSDRPDPLVATTIVSSSMLASIAKAHGARYTETLTGFKWLARAGAGLVYAYEEALGLCVNPDIVRDKDGIAAAVLACDLAATLKAAGRTLADGLDDLAVRHGVHLTEQISLPTPEAAACSSVMANLRSEPPTTLAATDVTAEDLSPDADVIRLRGDGIRVLVRPSGTEPKLKAYLEVTSDVPAPDDLATVRARARERLAALRADVTEIVG